MLVRKRFPFIVVLLLAATAPVLLSLQSPVPVQAQSVFIAPSSAPPGTFVSIAGNGFSTSDNNCVITASNPLLLAGSSCSISNGNVGASFTVASDVSPGLYTITVTGKIGSTSHDSDSTDFTLVAAITSISPAAGPAGTNVIVVAKGFELTDNTCDIGGTLGIAGEACSISSGTATASFTVGTQPTGSYTVDITAHDSDVTTPAVLFKVTAGPGIAMTSDGPVGTHVAVTGGGFSPGDAGSCQFSTAVTFTPSVLFGSPVCTIDSSGHLTGSFIVGAVPVGTYSVYVIGSTGDHSTDPFPFVVDPPPVLIFAPGSTATSYGSVFKITNTGSFSTGDTACTITSSPSTLIGASVCVISNGHLQASTEFVVANTPSGPYAVTVTGSPGADSATATFTVDVGAVLTLTPNLGSPGQVVSFKATGLSVGDTSCSVTATPSTFVLINSPSCSISSGTASGSFTVGAAATADVTWHVVVTGSPGGDTASKAFTVTPMITLSPDSGSTGTLVTVTGSGFSSAATGCSLYDTFGVLPNGRFGSAACGIASGSGQLSGSFVVTGAVVGAYVITAVDNSGDAFAASAVFSVGTPTAVLVLTPNIVSPGGTVTASGSGFNPSDNTCAFNSLPGGFTQLACNVGSGTLGGSLAVSSSISSGLYLITVTGTSGDFASAYVEVPFMVTTTTTTTPSSTIVSTTTGTVTTTSDQTTLTTTTFTSTGVSTWTSYTLTTTTIVGQATASSFTTTVTTQVATSATTTTTTTTTTSTFNVVSGQVTAPSPSSSSVSNADGGWFVPLSALGLIGWIVLRRFTL